MANDCSSAHSGSLRPFGLFGRPGKTGRRTQVGSGHADPGERVGMIEGRNMTASARGTVDEPGRNVARKRGLSRAIPNAG